MTPTINQTAKQPPFGTAALATTHRKVKPQFIKHKSPSLWKPSEKMDISQKQNLQRKRERARKGNDLLPCSNCRRRLRLHRCIFFCIGFSERKWSTVSFVGCVPVREKMCDVGRVMACCCVLRISSGRLRKA